MRNFHRLAWGLTFNAELQPGGCDWVLTEPTRWKIPNLETSTSGSGKMSEEQLAMYFIYSTSPSCQAPFWTLQTPFPDSICCWMQRGSSAS